MMKKVYSLSWGFNEGSFCGVKKIHQIKFCQFTPLQIERHPVRKKNPSSSLNQLQLNV